MRDVFDLPHLIADVVADVQPAADDKGVHVAAHSLAAMPQWVDGDEPALRRILLNTLDLVVGAATDGTVSLRLDPHESGRDRWTCVVAWRRGGGGGDNAIDEVTSTFIVALRPADSTDYAGPFRILVVDDSAQHRAMVAALLTPTAHAVTEADSGEDAIRRVGTDAFDVILMDVQMPGMGGLEAIRMIRAHESVRQLPPAFIVALSTMGASDDETASTLAGANACLPKPLGRDGLFRTLSAVRPAVAVGPQPAASEDLFTGQALAPSPLLAMTRQQLGAILQAASETQLERLRMLGHALKTTAADAGLSDIAHLAAALEDTSSAGSLTAAQTAARTLQAWILRGDVSRS